jgi:hypothetical protein
MATKSITDKIEEIKKELEELELKAEKPAKGKNDLPFEVGESYFFRTVTYHLIGKVKAIRSHFLVLKEVSWIADSGRFNEVINKGVWGTSAEIEPIEVDVVLNLNSITDSFVWEHQLPREVK